MLTLHISADKQFIISFFVGILLFMINMSFRFFDHCCCFCGPFYIFFSSLTRRIYTASTVLFLLFCAVQQLYCLWCNMCDENSQGSGVIYAYFYWSNPKIETMQVQKLTKMAKKLGERISIIASYWILIFILLKNYI